MYNRHKTYLTNQWWNGQQGEHNAETTFLSDIDWRFTFVQSIGDINIDFPDSEQFYKETDEDLNPPQIWPLGLTRRNTTRKSGGKYRRRKMNKMARKSKKNKKSKKHVGRKSK